MAAAATTLTKIHAALLRDKEYTFKMPEPPHEKIKDTAIEISDKEKGEQMSKKYWTGSVDFRSAVAITKEHKFVTIDEVEEFVRTKMLPHWPSEIEPLEFFDEHGRVIEGKE